MTTAATEASTRGTPTAAGGAAIPAAGIGVPPSSAARWVMTRLRSAVVFSNANVTHDSAQARTTPEMPVDSGGPAARKC
ncbi:hypothetical protein GCM10023222_53750 [Saccharopolyspora cebuensis]